MINTTVCTPGDINQILQTLYDLRMPAFLWGKPGIGKSDVVRQFAKKNKMRLIDIRLTTLESVDLRGLPWVVHQPDGKVETVWCRPEFFPVEDVPTVIFLDELVAAEPRIQASAYQLILDRCIGSHVLPEGAWVIGAGNAPEDGAISYAMGSALADRFVHLSVHATAKDWINWATENDIAPEVITFLKVHGQYLDSGEATKTEQLINPSPRSWERVSKIIKSNPSERARSMAVNGLVGEHVAVQFFHTLAEIGKLPPIEDLFKMKPEDAAKRIPANSQATLYGLTYSLVSFSTELEDFVKSMKILDAVSKDTRDKLPRREIETLGMELLLGKASKLKLLDKLVSSKDYATTYKHKAKEVVG